MDDDNLKDEVLSSILAKYNKLGWNDDLIKSQYREVKIFIALHSIEEGNVTVPADLIYYKYHNTKGDKAMPRNRFTFLFKLFFKMFKARGRNAFKMSPAPLDLPDNYSFYKDPRFWRSQTRKTKYMGIRAAPYGEWVAEIEVEGKKELIGYFKSSYQAARAWNEAMIYFYGEGAPQNKLSYGTKKKTSRKEKVYKKGKMARTKRKKTSKK